MLEAGGEISDDLTAARLRKGLQSLIDKIPISGYKARDLCQAVTRA